MSKKIKRLLSVVSIILCITLLSSIPTQALASTIEQNKNDTVSFDDVKGENEEIGNIVAEDKSARTEYSKEFILDDGTKMVAEYDQPVHYKNDKGKWTDYNNTLVTENNTATADEASNIDLVNKSSDIEIKLSNKAKSNNMISVNSKNYKVSWGYENTNKAKGIVKQNNEKLRGNDKFTTLKNLTSETVYENVYKNVDLQYFVSSTGIKENIILKSSDVQNEFYITYKINKLTAVQKDDYTIVLKDKKNIEVYTISAPFMYDKNGKISNQLKLEIVEQKGANLKVKLTADYWFIHGLGRAFPVTIDPEFTTKQNFNQTYFYEGSGQSVLSYGPYYLAQNNSVIVQAKTLPTLGDGDKLVSAKYNFECSNYSTLFNNSNENPIIVKAHKLNNASNGTFSYDSKVLDYDTLSYGNCQNLSFDLTNTMKEWYNNGSNIDGFVLEAFDTIGSKQVTLRSYTKESATPSLSVIYKNYTGTEPDLTYNTVSVGQNAESNISYCTGSLNIKQNIYEGTGSRMPAHITATYNSVLHDKLFANGSPAGYGWQFSFNQYIKETNSALQAVGYDYIYTDEDGTEHYFKEDDSSDIEQWKDEDNLNLTLTKDSNYLYLTNDDETVQKYNLPSVNGNIVSEKDKYDNTISYSYNSLGNLTKITDGAGREIKINYAYYSGNSEPRVYSIELPDSNIVQLAYYANQLLACVILPDEKSSWFNYTQYTSDGLLNRVEQRDCSDDADVYGMKYGYTYNSDNQVTSIKEYGSNNTLGNYLNFQYNNDNTTKVTDRKGLSETYTFDNYGKTVAILNANGYIESTSDSDDNALSISGGSESYTRNYIEESREPSSSYYSKVNGSSSTGGQLTYDTSTEEVNGEKVQYLGSKSIRIKNTGSTQFYTMAKHQYDDSDLFGKTLTFSSYVKTNNVNATSNASGVTGAFIKIECFDGSGNIIKEESSPGIVGSNGWQRISTTATIPANTDHFNIYCGIKDAQGTAWFDCLQLEEGNVMNDYNALQNSDFSTNDAWSNASVNNIKQIEGNGTSDRFVYQYVNINKSNVSFNISGEAKADSVPLNDENRTFGIALKIYYDGESINSPETHYVPFNDATNAYHSIGATITPEKTNKLINTVAFSFVYQYNENKMYLKNAMLNIGNMAYDSSASEEDINSSSDDEESDTEVTYPYDGSVSTYDSYGNTLSTKQGSVIKNSNGEEVIDTSKPFISTSSTYDSTGNYVTAEVDERGNTVSYNVNSANGNVTKVTDAKGNATNYSYDSVGNLISIGGTSNTYTYNSANQLSAISHNGFSYNFNYDVYNNLVSTVIGNTALVTNTYDSNNGNLTKTKYGNNQGLTYSYDNYDRITSITSIADGPLVNYNYNKKGLVTKAVERKSGQTTEYQYDCNGNLLRKNTTSNDGNSIAYSLGYDSLGNPVETVNLNGQTRTVTSGTDDNDNSYVDNGDSKITTVTDSLGRTEYINQVDNSTNKHFETSYEYAAGAESGSTTNIVSRYSQSYDGTDLVDYQYTYDANGNITQIKNNNILIAKYTYDNLNQLREEYDYVNKKYVNYSYDGKGNIFAQHTQSLDPTYGYPTGTVSGNTYEYNDTVWKDKLTKFNGKTITYDSIGNPLNYRDGMTMSWQVGRELKSVTLSDNTSISYTYNTNGMRICKNVGGTKTYYYYDDNNNLVGLTKGSTTMFFYYDSDNSPVSMSYNGTMYYYVKNLQGDIVKIINKSGTVYGTYTYDALGNIISSTGDPFVSLLNPLRYRGYVYDTDTGLYYLQSRYYDPKTGRFINADDTAYIGFTGTVLSTNLFIYCENNLINCVDTSGKFLLTLSATGLFYLAVTLTVSITAIAVVNTPSFKQGWSDLCNNIGSGLSKALDGLGNSINWISSKAKDIAKDISKSFSKAKSKPKYKKSTEVHHIVAKGSKKATEAQKVLSKVGINYKNDIRNLITIKTGLHRRLHTNKYYEFVNTLVIDAYNKGKSKDQKKSNVIRVLSNLKKIINSMNTISPF